MRMGMCPKHAINLSALLLQLSVPIVIENAHHTAIPLGAGSTASMVARYRPPMPILTLVVPQVNISTATHGAGFLKLIVRGKCRANTTPA